MRYGWLLLLSALAAADPALAQQKTGPGITGDESLTWHGITLYGVIDVGVQLDTHSAPFTPYRPAASGNIVRQNGSHSVTGLTPSNLGQSRVGLQGIEPLNEDWSAVFQVETFFNPQSGEVADSLKSLAVNNGRTLGTQSVGVDGSSAGQAFQTAYVGLKSARFGTLTFGRQVTLLSEGTIKYDPNYNATAFGLLGASNTYSGGGSSEDNRLDSTAKYYVSFNDLLHLAALYKFNGSYGSANTAVQADIGGEYAGGRCLLLEAKQRHHGNVVDFCPSREASGPGVFRIEFSGGDHIGQYDLFAHGLVQDRSVQILCRLHAHQVCQSIDTARRRVYRHRRLRSGIRHQQCLQQFEDRAGVLERRSLHRHSPPRPDLGLLRLQSERLRYRSAGGLLDLCAQHLQRQLGSLFLRCRLPIQPALRCIPRRHVQRRAQWAGQRLFLHHQHQPYRWSPVQVLNGPSRQRNCAPRQQMLSRIDWLRRQAAGGEPYSRLNARMKAVSVW